MEDLKKRVELLEGLLMRYRDVVGDNEGVDFVFQSNYTPEQWEVFSALISARDDPNNPDTGCVEVTGKAMPDEIRRQLHDGRACITVGCGSRRFDYEADTKNPLPMHSEHYLHQWYFRCVQCRRQVCYSMTARAGAEKLENPPAPFDPSKIKEMKPFQGTV